MPTIALSIPDEVRRMLAAGQTSAVDPTTGRSHSLYANCPTDGQRSSVRRISRGQSGSIVDVTMRCSRCAGDFVAAPESLSLR